MRIGMWPLHSVAIGREVHQKHARLGVAALAIRVGTCRFDAVLWPVPGVPEFSYLRVDLVRQHGIEVFSQVVKGVLNER